jgi:hypothetical protein
LKVKLRQIMAGPDGTYDAGQEVDLPDAMAVELISTHQADPVDPIPAEVAVAKTRGARTATLPASK